MGRSMGWVFWTSAALLVWHQPNAEAVILINELLADPPALVGDANGDGVVSTTQDEFIELVNTAAGSVSLEGWSLSDLIGVRHRFVAGDAAPGFGFFVVFGGGAPAGFLNAAIASTGTLALNNTGDTVTLRDNALHPIDIVVYGSEGGMDVSLTRYPDATGPFVKHTSFGQSAFSPGRTIDGQLVLPHEEEGGRPVVPEPLTLLLVGGGLVALPRLRGRRS